MRWLKWVWVLGLVGAEVLAQQTSQLLPRVDGHYRIQTVNFADRDWRLDDFSHVGYYLGTRALGEVPPNEFTVDPADDITDAVQAAIEAAGAAGGGRVRIPGGTFTISREIGRAACRERGEN